MDSFWDKVSPEPNTGCWLWLGSAGPNNYGVWYDGRKTRPAHRIAWELMNGQPMPRGLYACHTCDNGWCVNPAHILARSPSWNRRDAVRKGRAVRSESSRRQASESMRAWWAAQSNREFLKLRAAIRRSRAA